MTAQKYFVEAGKQYDDYICLDKITKKGQGNFYIMKCTKCGKIKEMRGSTVGMHKGTRHKSCGKGLGVSYDADFYHRWQSMRARTSPNFWNSENYYDRGINSDAFESFIDFFNAMYPSWLEHKKRFGAKDTSLERIDVDKPYSPENCKWICFDEQKGNLQKSIYFTRQNVQTGEITYHKNALRFARETKAVPASYIYDVINKNKTYNGYEYKRITKEEYAEHNLQEYEKCNDYRKDN